MSLALVEVEYKNHLLGRNYLKYVIKKIGDQSVDKASDNDENDVERNEENKNDESQDKNHSRVVLSRQFFVWCNFKPIYYFPDIKHITQTGLIILLLILDNSNFINLSW